MIESTKIGFGPDKIVQIMTKRKLMDWLIGIDVPNHLRWTNPKSKNRNSFSAKLHNDMKLHNFRHFNWSFSYLRYRPYRMVHTIWLTCYEPGCIKLLIAHCIDTVYCCVSWVLFAFVFQIVMNENALIGINNELFCFESFQIWIP